MSENDDRPTDDMSARVPQVDTGTHDGPTEPAEPAGSEPTIEEPGAEATPTWAPPADPTPSWSAPSWWAAPESDGRVDEGAGPVDGPMAAPPNAPAPGSPPTASPSPSAPTPAPSDPMTPPPPAPPGPFTAPPPAAPPPMAPPSWGQAAPAPGMPPTAPSPQGGYPAPTGPATPPPAIPGSPPPTAPPSGGSNRVLWAVLGGLLAIGLIGGLVALVANGDDTETATDAGDDQPATDTDDNDDPGIGSETTDTGTDTGDGDPSTDGPIGAEQLARSVVQIQLLLDGEPVCTGSGTVIDAKGTVLTNFHVVEQSPICPHDDIAVAVAESSQSIPTVAYVADLLAFDAALDLAVIRVRETVDGGPVVDPFEPIILGDSDDVELGDQLQVIGFPGIGGETVTFTTGSVSGFAETPEGGVRSWLKTDATIAGGNSGGLAADADGRFVGIPTRAGSGDGEIVDCRVITDSNGDGELTGEDSCVPIGGFINGIRPLALALPLLEEAETASPIDQGEPTRDDPMNPVLPIAFNPTWTSTIDADGFATDRLAAASAGIPEVCVTWDYDDVPGQAIIEGIWLIDGDLDEDASIPPVTNDGTTSGSYWACISNADGLAAATYEFVWFVDDELVFGEAIVVADGATATIEVQNEHDLDICVVQFNPNNTSTWGLNEIGEPLEPGESITVTVAVGPIDARIVDCSGDTRIEDASGFVVDEDILLGVD